MSESGGQAVESIASYVDIHTHQRTTSHGIRIVNVSVDVIFADGMEYPHASVGIHPCSPSSATGEDAFARLQELAALPNVIAIGECGFDCHSDLLPEAQSLLFARQLKLADDLKKPLIVHCVKMFDELIKIKRNERPEIPMIVHGFNKSPELAACLLKQGFFLSFGHALLSKKSHALAALRNCVIDRLFLETDEANVTIEGIYEAAAETLQVANEALILNIHQNFRRIFHV